MPVTKLIIQIPCLNEEEQLPTTLAALPRSIAGIDVVEWLVIDDGSTDTTVEVAKQHGVDHIVKLPSNRGLAAAFQAGVQASLALGADIIVNTDADNQYPGGDIPKLVSPILSGSADVVVGDRGVADVADFSRLKRRLQVLGSRVVSAAAGEQIPDVTSGFRAYSRHAAESIMVVNRYTYTIESTIQAAKRGLVVESVRVGKNEATRPSRLFGSTLSYVRRNAVTIVRVFASYHPLRFFGALAIMSLIAGLACFTPFLWDAIVNDDTAGHLQSIILGAIFTLGATQLAALAVIGDLVASHRSVSQRMLETVRRVEHTEPPRPPYLHMTSDPRWATSDEPLGPDHNAAGG